jgi:hypothetical protein
MAGVRIEGKVLQVRRANASAKYHAGTGRTSGFFESWSPAAEYAQTRPWREAFPENALLRRFAIDIPAWAAMLGVFLND